VPWSRSVGPWDRGRGPWDRGRDPRGRGRDPWGRDSPGRGRDPWRRGPRGRGRGSRSWSLGLGSRSRNVHWVVIQERSQGIASGTYFIHERRVIHSDIKPENILMERDKAMLGDFGGAVRVADVATRPVICTPVGLCERFSSCRDLASTAGPAASGAEVEVGRGRGPWGSGHGPWDRGRGPGVRSRSPLGRRSRTTRRRGRDFWGRGRSP